MNPLKKGVNKIAWALGLRWLLSQARGVAEGKHGPGLQGAYLWSIGKKRYTSLALGVVAGVLAAFGVTEAATYAATAAGVLMSLGLVDDSWRAPCAPSWLREVAWYRWLEAHAELVTGLFAFVAGTGGLLEMCGDDCATAARVLLVVAAIGVHLGLLPQAWRSRPPQLEYAGIAINAHDVSDVKALLEARRNGNGSRG